MIKRLPLTRHNLQRAVAICSLVPVLAGLSGIIWGKNVIGLEPGSIALDSHVRYLSGILFAIGLGFISTIPAIETQEKRFQLLTFLVVAGGLARLGGVFLVGWPSMGMIFALFMELGVTPLLCLWQARIARTYGA